MSQPPPPIGFRGNESCCGSGTAQGFAGCRIAAGRRPARALRLPSIEVEASARCSVAMSAAKKGGRKRAREFKLGGQRAQQVHQARANAVAAQFDKLAPDVRASRRFLTQARDAAGQAGGFTAADVGDRARIKTSWRLSQHDRPHAGRRGHREGGEARAAAGWCFYGGRARAGANSQGRGF